MLVESCHLEMTNDQRLSKHLLGVSKCQKVQACNAEVLISLFLSRESRNEIKQTIKANQPDKNPILNKKTVESPNQYKSESFMKIQHCCNADNFCESLFGSDTQLSTRKLGFKGQR